MKVLKFGSASIRNACKIKDAVSIILKEKTGIIVLSSIMGTAEALSEISDYLYKKNDEGANEIINKLELDYIGLISDLFTQSEFKTTAVKLVTAKFDYIRSFADGLFTLFEERIVMAQGEILSSEIIHLLIEENNGNAKLISALDFIRTDKNSLPNTAYIKEQLAVVLQENKNCDLYITQGYICRNAYDEIDDLRKGGSDYTAALIGAAIDASEIQIWSDVDVMQNNDARYVENTKVIRQLNFDEAAELTYFGSKILHPSSISPAKLANIPIKLKNTNSVDDDGTLISNDIEHNVIKAIAAKDGITAIKIKSGRMLLAHGFLRRIFEIFENYQTSIDMLTTSEVGVSVTIDNNHNLINILDDLKKYGTVTVDNDMVIIAVVGDLDWENVSLESKILDAVKEIPIRKISYGGSNYNISILVKSKDKEKALQILNSKLFNN